MSTSGDEWTDGSEIMSVRADTKRLNSFRDESGALMSTVDGGYPVLYFTACIEICADCANKDESQISDLVTGCEVYYEGPTIQCEDCGKDIESAYGDPDEDED